MVYLRLSLSRAAPNAAQGVRSVPRPSLRCPGLTASSCSPCRCPFRVLVGLFGHALRLQRRGARVRGLRCRSWNRGETKAMVAVGNDGFLLMVSRDWSI
jgi:hypothetical protein